MKNSQISQNFINLTSKQEKEIQNLLYKLNKQESVFVNCMWTDLKISKWVGKIEVWNLISLQAYSNYCSSIIYEIKEIDFPKLTKLNLQENKIESVEAFSYLKAPCLTQLILCSNRIHQISALKKIISRNIQWISMYQNKCTQADTFYEANFPQLNRLTLSSTNDYFCWTNTRIILKLESQQLKNLHILSYRHIRDQAMIKRLSKKMQCLSIYKKVI